MEDLTLQSDEILQQRKLTHAEIKQMRRSGLPKPKDLTWADWNAPLQLSPRQEVVCHMSAIGRPNKRIAEETGYSYAQVSKILKSDIGTFRVQELQHQLFGSNHEKRFKALLDDAINTTASIMSDSQNKATTRLSAAREIMDRSMGKPTQAVEVRDTTLKDFYSKLEDLYVMKPKDVISVSNEIDEAEIVPIKRIENSKEESEEELDAVDQWFEKNYD